MDYSATVAANVVAARVWSAWYLVMSDGSVVGTGMSDEWGDAGYQYWGVDDLATDDGGTTYYVPSSSCDYLPQIVISNAALDAAACAALAEAVAASTPGCAAVAFAEHVVTTDADQAASVFSVDLDGDGDADLLSASYDDDTVAWYDNDGAQTFAKTDVYDGANGACSVFAIDVDGDGDVDVLGTSKFDDLIRWYENDGAAAPSFLPHTIASGYDPFRVFAADVDGDGAVDVMNANWAGYSLYVHANDGDEVFSQVYVKDGGMSNPRGVARPRPKQGDAGNDLGRELGPRLPERARGGEIASRSTRLGSRAQVFATDVDGDAIVDVLSAAKGSNEIAWHEHDGAWGFTEHVIHDADGPRCVYAIDVDGDADVDVIGAATSGDALFWYLCRCL